MEGPCTCPDLCTAICMCVCVCVCVCVCMPWRVLARARICILPNVCIFV